MEERRGRHCDQGTIQLRQCTLRVFLWPAGAGPHHMPVHADGPVAIETWAEAHKASFKPPICNKLMHKGQLSVMFVGGPNTRTDFHVEEGSELFLQVHLFVAAGAVSSPRRLTQFLSAQG